MKKIGFIDYYLDEWHANNYPTWIKAKNRNFEVCFAYGEIASPHDGKTSEQWCLENDITLCSSVKEICEKSDYIVILSPDNSERHLMYAKQVLPFGKPTYIDKTFAPNVADAIAMFDISRKYNCPICSTSALRYADELNGLDNIENMVSIGGGLTYDIYAIHQLEMIVRLMGSDVKCIKATQNTKTINLTLQFHDGRTAGLVQNVYCYDLLFMLLTEHTNEENTRYTSIQSDYFQNFINGLLDFFAKGEKMASEDETLSVIGLIEAGEKALLQPDKWIEVET